MSLIEIEKDLRGQFGGARDQGSRPTCLAFAISDTHAAIRSKSWTELSCEYLFYQAKQNESSPPEHGTTVPAISEALERYGQPVETDWPYLSRLPSDLATWEPPTEITRLFKRDSKEHKGSFDGVYTSIENDTPAIIVMSLSNSFFQPSSDGLIESNEPIDPTLSHAVVGVAVGRKGKERFILVRNSWGDAWGLSGYAWVCEKYLSPRIILTIYLKKE